MKLWLTIGCAIAGAVIGGGLSVGQRQDLCNQGLTQIPGVNQVCKLWVTPGAAIDGVLLGGIVGLGLGAIGSSLLDDGEFDPRLITWVCVGAIATTQLLSTQPKVEAIAAVNPTANPTENMDKELRAFAEVIAHAEDTKDRYDILMGHGTFTDFSKHPDQCVAFFNPATQQPDCSTAAGRYQYRTDTWYEWANIAGAKDFSQQSQDKVLFTHLTHLGIPQLLKQGKFKQALEKAAPVWVSLYPNDSKQRVAPFEELKSVYEKSLAESKAR